MGCVPLAIAICALWRYGWLAAARSSDVNPLARDRQRALVASVALPTIVFLSGAAIEALLVGDFPRGATESGGLLILAATAAMDGAVLPAAAALLSSWLLHSPYQACCLLLPLLLCAAAGGEAGSGSRRAPWRSTVGATVAYLVALWLMLAALEPHPRDAAAPLLWLLPSLSLPATRALAARSAARVADLAARLYAARDGTAAAALLRGAVPLATVDASSVVLPVELNLTWYVNSASFSRYLPYFSTFFLGHPLLYVLPLLSRLRRRPDLALVIVAALAALFDSTAHWSLARFPVVAALLLSHSQVVARMTGGSAHVWLGLLVAAVAAAPAMKYSWLVLLSGTPNFLFNMSLAVAVAGGSLLADYALAALRLQKRQRLEAAAAAPASIA